MHQPEIVLGIIILHSPLEINLVVWQNYQVVSNNTSSNPKFRMKEKGYAKILAGNFAMKSRWVTHKGVRVFISDFSIYGSDAAAMQEEMDRLVKQV